MNSLSVDSLIKALALEAHDEGGFFRQIYQSGWQTPTPDRAGTSRWGVNTIYYLLTKQSPIGHLHRNESEIIHFFHAGSPLTYLIVSPEGELSRIVMGPNPAAGHVFQMTVPGGYWKTSFLTDDEYGLISEAVVPGFDYRDRELATLETISQLFPDLATELTPYILAH